MNAAVTWQAAGRYFEACNCDSVCPCYTAHAPTYGYCEGNCAWHIEQGQFGEVTLDDLNVIMVQRCDGHMRETKWKCWFFVDDRAMPEQFDALQQIFALTAGGHLANIFSKLWDIQNVRRAKIEFKDDPRPRASILGKLGLAIGLLKPEAGPALCRIPNVPGDAAIAEEDWFDDGTLKFNYRNQNALSTRFMYHSD